MGKIIKNALVAAILTAILVTPILGLQLKLEGVDVQLLMNFQPVMIAVALVFVFQLFRPALAAVFSNVSRAVSGHIPTLPTLQGTSKNIVWGLVFLVAIIWPFVGPRGGVAISTAALIYIVLGLGLNITVGFAGLLDLGYVAFYAVGAYTYALLNQYFGLTFWECLPLGVITASLFALLLGFPVLRLRGDYLAIVTLGFSEILRMLFTNGINTPWFVLNTGGPNGISHLPKPTVFGMEMARSASVEGTRTFHEIIGLDYQGMHMVIYLYLIALALAAFTLFFTGRLARMPMGRAWEALRENEIACRSLGLNPTWIKLSAYIMGAAFAGLAGVFFASLQGQVTPGSFKFDESALILSIVVLGGMGSRMGVVLAAILLTVLPEMAREFSDYRMLAFGLVMVLMMIWRPEGLLPAKRRHVELPS